MSGATLATRRDLLADAEERLAELRPELVPADYAYRAAALTEARTDPLAPWEELLPLALRPVAMPWWPHARGWSLGYRHGFRDPRRFGRPDAVTEGYCAPLEAEREAEAAKVGQPLSREAGAFHEGYDSAYEAALEVPVP